MKTRPRKSHVKMRRQQIVRTQEPRKHSLGLQKNCEFPTRWNIQLMTKNCRFPLNSCAINHAKPSNSERERSKCEKKLQTIGCFCKKSQLTNGFFRKLLNTTPGDEPLDCSRDQICQIDVTTNVSQLSTQWVFRFSSECSWPNDVLVRSGDPNVPRTMATMLQTHCSKKKKYESRTLLCANNQPTQSVDTPTHTTKYKTRCTLVFGWSTGQK